MGDIPSLAIIPVAGFFEAISMLAAILSSSIREDNPTLSILLVACY